MRKRFSFSTASCERRTVLRYCTMPMLASSTITDITTNSSMIVKPSGFRNRFIAVTLPVAVLRAIERGTRTLCVHVVDVLPAPGRGVPFVLVSPQTPVAVAGERIDRTPAEELQLPPRGIVGARHAVNER